MRELVPAVVLAPVVLAVVLVVSAVAKLRDPASLDAGFRELKVPDWLGAPWLRRLVPWFELALAGGLLFLPAPFNVVAALGATVLFAVYTVLIVRAWRAPEAADCHCFGSLATGRVSGWTVVRNTILLALSLVAIVDAVGSAPLVVRLLDAASLGWVAGAAVVALLVFSIVREPGERAGGGADAVEGPFGVAAGTAGGLDEGDGSEDEYVRLPIPYSRLTTASGDRVPLRNLAASRAQLLVYVSAGCGGCQDVIAAMPGWQEAMPEIDVRPVVWPGGEVPETLAPLADLVLVDDEQVMSLLELGATPGAVLLGADGLIAGGPVRGGADVTDLAEGMIEQLAEARAAYEQAAQQ